MKKHSLEPMAQFFNSRAEAYDEVHTSHIDGGRASKDIVAGLLPEGTRRILDLGVGTGLELEAVFMRFPEARVTGIDMAEDMLQKLRERFPGKEMELVCGSYLDLDFGAAQYDAVISVMSLHHLLPAQKRLLFERVRKSLVPGGVFLNCDYFAPSRVYELRRRAMLWAMRAQPGSVHFDIPMTARHEMNIMRSSGFCHVEDVWKQGNTWVLEAKADQQGKTLRK